MIVHRFHSLDSILYNGTSKEEGNKYEIDGDFFNKTISVTRKKITENRFEINHNGNIYYVISLIKWCTIRPNYMNKTWSTLISDIICNSNQ